MTNTQQPSFRQTKDDGIYAGRLLMKDEVLRLIKATNPTRTKAIQKTIELIEGIQIYADPTELNR
jgi:hypothetical protein